MTAVTHLRQVIARNFAVRCDLQRQLHEQVGVLVVALEVPVARAMRWSLGVLT